MLRMVPEGTQVAVVHPQRLEHNGPAAGGDRRPAGRGSRSRPRRRPLLYAAPGIQTSYLTVRSLTVARECVGVPHRSEAASFSALGNRVRVVR